MIQTTTPRLLSSSQIVSHTTPVYHQSCETLLKQAVDQGEGCFNADGAFCTQTGTFTGRSPKDRFIVRDSLTENTVDWGPVNQALPKKCFESLKRRVYEHIQGKTLYTQDLYVGSDKQHRVNLRVICEQAWHAAFARTLLCRPEKEELEIFEPDWTLIQCPSLESTPAEDGTNSGTFVVLDFSERLILIGGTAYAGEIKKSAFSLLNYLLPEKGVMPMHCSANQSPEGDIALFFGLSGTGKTTLSADAGRHLIGDDEHGWSDRGVFNFEGGCYAKAAHLSAEREPEIFAASSQPGAILENVALDKTGRPDFSDTSLTENTRCAYPLHHIKDAVTPAAGGHPKHLIFLTLDAFGVLPPLSLLNPKQAVEYFLIGYTSKVAGTERGLGNKPEATFSTCYGAPFMSRPPQTYAHLLQNKILKNKSQVWLVNTGWIGGAYGKGKRISLTHTRNLIRSVLANNLESADFWVDPVFGLAIPCHCPGVPDTILDPEKNWQDSKVYRKTAESLKAQFDARLSTFRNRFDAGPVVLV